MVDKSVDFMLEEYKQIANGYQDLHTQHNELVKFFISLVAIPASILAIASQLLGNLIQTDTTISNSMIEIVIPVLGILLIALSFIGLAVFIALIFIRKEALLYVKTINCIRRYFIDKDTNKDIENYLLLSSRDTFPKFWEGLGSRSFWNGAIVAILNAAIWVITLQTFNKLQSWNFAPILLLPIAAVLVALQIIIQWTILEYNDQQYKSIFENKKTEKPLLLIDLDGVICDLLHGVIAYSRKRFNIKINPAQITTHNLTECTDLTKENIFAMFSDPDFFKNLKPIKNVVKSFKRLKDLGYKVNVITDRFWTSADWTISIDWLMKHKIFPDSFNLVRQAERRKYVEIHHTNILVEDNLQTVQNLENLEIKVFLMDRPYNQGVITNNANRVSTWDEIISSLEAS